MCARHVLLLFVRMRRDHEGAQEQQTQAWLDRQQRRLEVETVVVHSCRADEDDGLTFDGLLWHVGVLWHLSGRLVRRKVDARLALSGLSVRALRPVDEPLTTRILKSLPIELIRKRVAAIARDEYELDLWSDALLGTTLADAKTVHTAEGSLYVPPLGRAGTPDRFFIELAGEAVRIAAAGGNVRGVLAERRQRSERRVQEWLSEARARGYLDPTPRVWRLGPEHPASPRPEGGDGRQSHKRRDGRSH